MFFRIQCGFLYILALYQVQADGGFEQGKEYTYSYFASHATGVRKQQLAGRKYMALLTIQQNEEGHLAFKIHDFHTEAFHHSSSDFQTGLHHHKEEITDNGNKLKENLEKTFTATYDNGLIKAISISEGTDLSVVNIKKAIVSLFQLNLKQNGGTYEVQEDGIGGECTTNYQVFPYPHDPHLTTVIKTRLYNQCKYRPHLFFSSMIGYKCPRCQEASTEALSSNGRIKYRINRGKDQNVYTIQKIYSYGVIKFTPFTSNGQTVLSDAHQTLELINITEVDAILDLTGNYKNHPSLAYEFQNDKRDLDTIDLKETNYGDRIFAHHEPRSREDAELSLLSKIKSLDLEDPSSCIIPLVEELRRMNYDDFVYFFERNVNLVTTLQKIHEYADANVTAEQLNVRDLLMRVLPMVGTNPSILFMLKLIDEEKMLESHIINALTTFAFYVKEPSEKLLDYLSDSVFNTSLGTPSPYHRQYGRVGYLNLAFGTLVFRACVQNDFNPHPAHQTTYIAEEKCGEYVQKLIERYTNRVDSARDVKAIGNTRHEKAFPFLLSIFKDSSLTRASLYQNESPRRMDRIAAMWGLWSFLGDPSKSKQVADVSASVFRNTTEDYQIRLYAFWGWMLSSPSATFFHNIVDIVNTETNDKVAIHIYQMLSIFANSTDPCYASFKEPSRQVLQYLQPPQSENIKHGFQHHYFVFNEKYNYGRMTDFYAIPGSETYFPRDFYAKHAANLLGYNFDILEAGFIGRSYETGMGLARILGWNVRTPYVHSVMTQTIPVPTKLKGLDDYKPLFRRFEDGFTHVYFRKFGQFTHYKTLPDFLALFSVNAMDSLIELSEHVEDPLTRSAYQQKVTFRKNTLNFVDVEGVVPNEMGLPVVLSLQMPMSVGVHGSIGAKYNISNREIQHAQIVLNLNSSAREHLYGRMYVDSKNFASSGYEIHTSAGFNLPINTTLNFDVPAKKLVAKYTPPPASHEIFHYHSKPTTFDASTQLPIVFKEKPTEKLYHFGHNYFGLGLTFNFTYDRTDNTFGSYRQIFKSFFKNTNSYEDYFTLGEKLFGGTSNFLNYALFNPTGKPFEMHVRFGPCKYNPTTEVTSTIILTAADLTDENHLNATGWQYDLNVEAKGPKTRSWSAHFEGRKRWPYRDSREVSFNFKRSSIPGFDAEPSEICFESKSSIDNQANLFARPKTRTEANVKWNYEAYLKVGKTCDNHFKKISITGLGKKSETQENLKTDDLDFYKHCEIDEENGFEFSPSCWAVLKDRGRLDKFSFLIQHNNISTELKGIAHKLYGWFRHTFYDHLHIDHFHGNNKEGQIELVANLSYFEPLLDVTVTRPDLTVHYHNIFLPALIPRFEPISVAKYAHERFMSNIFNTLKPLCILSGDYVKTFDDVVYKRKNDPSCSYLAFGNIRDKNGFVIVNKKSTTIHLYKDVIEITSADERLSLSINGETKDVNDKKPLKMELTDYKKIIERYDPTPICPVVIFRYYAGIVVNSPEHQLVVYADGHNVKIQTSLQSFGSMTGLCGLYDGNKKKEFVSFDTKEHKNIEDFVESFTLEGCSKNNTTNPTTEEETV